MEKKYWTNFDLLEEVKTICAEKKLPPFAKGHNAVAEKLLQLIGEKDISDKDIHNFKCRYFRVMQKFKPSHGNYEHPKVKEYGNEVFVVLKDKEDISSEASLSSQSSSSQDVLPGRSSRRKNLKELVLGGTQMKYRLDPLITDVKTYASENDIDVTELLGLIIYVINWPAKGEGSKVKAKIGRELFNGNTPVGEISNDVALNFLTKYKFGKRQYTELRLDLKRFVDFPSYNDIRKAKNMLIPVIDNGLPSSLVGVKYVYNDALTKHYQRYFENKTDLCATNYKAIIKDGCDGSGRHSLYSQKNNVETHAIVSLMFVPLEMYEKKINPSPSENKYIIVDSETLPNSADRARPIALIMGKENSDTLKQLYPRVQKEIAEIQNDGLCIKIGERCINLEIEIKSTMTDGASKKLLTGRGGAYCIVSKCSREDGNNYQKYIDGLPMKGVTVDELWEMFRAVEKGGKISKRIPSRDRFGLTQEPLLTSTNVNYLPVLHSLLRVFDWCLKVVYHLRAKLSSWNENNSDKGAIEIAKKEVKDYMRNKTGIVVDEPDSTGAGGNTNTGNNVRNILWNKTNRDALADCVPENKKNLVQSTFRNLAIILRLVSSNCKIDLEKFDILCKNTAQNILIAFNGEIQITPTLHVLLAHGCALVEENGGYGLKIFSEEPLESNNKYIRKFRENLARKTNQIENLTDVCARLWVKSDPIICSIKRKQYCTFCKIHTDHTSLSSTCPEKIKFSPQQEDDAFLDQFLDKNSAE